MFYSLAGLAFIFWEFQWSNKPLFQSSIYSELKLSGTVISLTFSITQTPALHRPCILLLLFSRFNMCGFIKSTCLSLKELDKHQQHPLVQAGTHAWKEESASECSSSSIPSTSHWRHPRAGMQLDALWCWILAGSLQQSSPPSFCKASMVWPCETHGQLWNQSLSLNIT